MKILRLDLRAFGPFTNETIDLSAGNKGLHIIYGPNEAGKSSTRKALQQFLFGIPGQERSVSFVHDYPKLRIGAVIERADGTSITLIRRKGNAKTLRAGDDQAAVPDEVLAECLAGLDETLYEKMFGIDQVGLRKGGEEILTGGGNFGELLFAASAGLAGLGPVQEGLHEQMESLFKPGGSKPELNMLAAEYRDAKKELSQLHLSHEDWSKQDQALADARKSIETLGEQIRKSEGRRSRLERLQQSLEPMAERKELLRQFEPVSTAVQLRSEFTEERIRAENDLKASEISRDEAVRELEEVGGKVERIEVPQTLLNEAEHVDELYQRLGEYRKSLKDRPQRDVDRRTKEHEAKEILRELGRPASLESVESLRLTSEECIQIRTLGNQAEALVNNRDQAQHLLSTLTLQHEQAAATLANQPAPQPLEALRNAVRATQRLGEPEEQLASMERDESKAQQVAEMALKRLAYWNGTLEKLESLAIPDERTLASFEESQSTLAQAATECDGRLAEIERELTAQQKALRGMEAQQEVPTEHDLTSVRQERSAGWELVRSAWLQGDESRAGEFVQRILPGRHLADAYETTVRQADEVVDRLRYEADRVAQKATLLTELAQLGQHRADWQGRLDEARSKLQEQEQNWQRFLQSRGLPALKLAEIRGWIKAQAELVTQGAELGTRRKQCQEIEAKIHAARNALNDALGEANADERLVARLDRALQVIRDGESAATARDTRHDALTGLATDLLDANSNFTTAEEKLARWQMKWTPLMTRLGLPADATPEVAQHYVEKVQAVFFLLKEADGFLRRIKGMDRDIGAFTDDVRDLALRVAPDLAEGSADGIAQTLQRRLVAVRAAVQERTGLETRQTSAQGRLQDAVRNRTDAERRLAELCREADCSSSNQLPEAETKSKKRSALEISLSSCEKQLRRLSAGATVIDWIAEVEQADPDQLVAEMSACEVELKRLRVAESQAHQAIGSATGELDKMNGAGRAAAAAQRLQELLARFHVLVPQYMKLKLADTVLKRAVERYRDNNQGPVLSRASHLFATLTGQSFSALRLDYDADSGKLVLFAVRSADASVPMSGLSDGTRDQLYLALRIATLEVWLNRHEPIPFVVDDILLTFDDRRARAALHVLEKFSEHTQVLFFTLHQHLVNLAQTHLDPSRTFFHQLGRPCALGSIGSPV